MLLAILMEGAREQGTELVSDDPLAQSIKTANTLPALLGIIPAQFGDTEVDLTQSLATVQGDDFEYPPFLEALENEIIPRPIGVPFDFVASREIPLAPSPPFLLAGEGLFPTTRTPAIDPSDAEMAEFAGAMSMAYRADFEARVASERAAFAAANDPTLVEPPDTEAGRLTRGLPAPSPGGGGTFQGVDPVARFREMFDRRFKPETERLRALGDVRANVTNVYASLRTMSSLIRGDR